MADAWGMPLAELDRLMPIGEVALWPAYFAWKKEHEKDKDGGVINV